MPLLKPKTPPDRAALIGRCLPPERTRLDRRRAQIQESCAAPTPQEKLQPRHSLTPSRTKPQMKVFSKEMRRHGLLASRCPNNTRGLAGNYVSYGLSPAKLNVLDSGYRFDDVGANPASFDVVTRSMAYGSEERAMKYLPKTVQR